MEQGIFEIPSIATVLATTSEIATPVFNWMLPTALYFLGISLGAIVLYWLIGVIVDAVSALSNRNSTRKDWGPAYGNENVSFIEHFKAMRIGRDSD